jgi:hypothetical protein
VENPQWGLPKNWEKVEGWGRVNASYYTQPKKVLKSFLFWSIAKWKGIGFWYRDQRFESFYSSLFVPLPRVVHFVGGGAIAGGASSGGR